ncbi:MAG: outer membrane beta-barrel protein [Thermonemataceae bacterium]|nr:outer membrane beta-barrel protein [Thermonemataceae bacterium]
MKKIYTFLLFFFSISTLLAQNTGTIKGQLKDNISGEAIIGATILLKGTNLGASTDVDGNFQITGIPEGKYTMAISSIGYDSKEIENIEVQAGKVILLNTTINPEQDSEIGAVEVVARKETSTSMAVIAEIKEAEQVAVGISSEQIQKSQDRDAAQVLRRIPGVSLQDSRFAIVRGLPQRYNAVLINDIYAPSSEVDTRAFSFDLVPSNMIDRVLIYKSGGGDLPGDFAGGAIKIYTKNAPEENFANLTITFGARLGTTLNKVQDYQGSKTDFLGFDNGLRKLPSSYPSFLSNNLSNTERATFGRELTPNLAFSEQSVLPDLRFSFNLGRRIETKGDWRIGTLTSINYSNTHQFYESEFNNFQNIRTTYPSPKSAAFIDDTYTNYFGLGALHNWYFSKGNNTFEFKNLFNQKSFKQSLIREGADLINGVDNKNYSQRFEQKTFYGSQVMGKHKFREEKTIFSWAAGFNYSNKSEPDWRRFVSNRPTGSTQEYQISIPGSGNLFDGRYFSKLNEFAYSGSFKLDYKLGDKPNPTKLTGGLYAERKNRDFQARYFSYIIPATADQNSLNNVLGLPLGEIFQPANVDGVNVFTFVEGTSSVDSYKAYNTLLAPYVSAYIPFEDFSVSLGLRTEYNIQEVETKNLSGTSENADNRIFSILPSLNATYNLNDKQLLRFAYARTVNRPEFRELAPFIFYDFNLNASITGNSRLKTATIDNADFRWEYYPSASELISAGVFYKYFTNPIESYLQNTSGGAGTSNFAFSFGNAVNAQAYGVEVEIRKSLQNLNAPQFIKDLSVVANASVIFSSVDVGNKVDLGPALGDIVVDAPKERTLVGQSPYLVNVGLYYESEKSGWSANVLYNVAGPRLYLVGNTNSPSFYENQRHILDFNISKKLFDNKWELRFGVQDVLNQNQRFIQDANLDGKIGSEDGDIRNYKPGVITNLSIKYNF